VYFYPNGKVKLDLNYNMGKLEGILTAFDDQGNILEKAEYMDNQLIKKIK
jgi:antitoxin component YwqK of YwqJK toxin-antitoxin module